MVGTLQACAAGSTSTSAISSTYIAWRPRRYLHDARRTLLAASCSCLGCVVLSWGSCRGLFVVRGDKRRRAFIYRGAAAGRRAAQRLWPPLAAPMLLAACARPLRLYSTQAGWWVGGWGGCGLRGASRAAICFGSGMYAQHAASSQAHPRRGPCTEIWVGAATQRARKLVDRMAARSYC